MDPVRQALVVVHKGSASAPLMRQCKICNKIICESNDPANNMAYHIYSHFERIILKGVGGYFIRIDMYRTRSMNSVVDIIPHILYIVPTIPDEFARLISNTIREFHKEISDAGYIKYESIHALMCHYKLSEHRSRIMNIFDNIQFKCSMIVTTNARRNVCGQIYECGLPTADLVIQHLNSHLV